MEYFLAGVVGLVVVLVYYCIKGAFSGWSAKDMYEMGHTDAVSDIKGYGIEEVERLHHLCKTGSLYDDGYMDAINEHKDSND